MCSAASFTTITVKQRNCFFDPGWSFRTLQDEHLLDAMAERVRSSPQIMRQRKEIVEHPFGTIKRAMNQGYFLLRGQPKVHTEMSLTVLAYNIKRVITILGVPAMIAAVAVSGIGGISIGTAVLWGLVGIIAVLWSKPNAWDREFSHGLARCWATTNAYENSCLETMLLEHL